MTALKEELLERSTQALIRKGVAVTGGEVYSVDYPDDNEDGHITRQRCVYDCVYDDVVVRMFVDFTDGGSSNSLVTVDRHSENNPLTASDKVLYFMGAEIAIIRDYGRFSIDECPPLGDAPVDLPDDPCLATAWRVHMTLALSHPGEYLGNDNEVLLSMLAAELTGLPEHGQYTIHNGAGDNALPEGNSGVGDYDNWQSLVSYIKDQGTGIHNVVGTLTEGLYISHHGMNAPVRPDGLSMTFKDTRGLIYDLNERGYGVPLVYTVQASNDTHDGFDGTWEDIWTLNQPTFDNSQTEWSVNDFTLSCDVDKIGNTNTLPPAVTPPPPCAAPSPQWRLKLDLEAAWAGYSGTTVSITLSDLVFPGQSDPDTVIISNINGGDVTVNGTDIIGTYTLDINEPLYLFCTFSTDIELKNWSILARVHETVPTAPSPAVITRTTTHREVDGNGTWVLAGTQDQPWRPTPPLDVWRLSYGQGCPLSIPPVIADDPIINIPSPPPVPEGPCDDPTAVASQWQIKLDLQNTDPNFTGFTKSIDITSFNLVNAPATLTNIDIFDVSSAQTTSFLPGDTVSGVFQGYSGSSVSIRLFFSEPVRMGEWTLAYRWHDYATSIPDITIIKGWTTKGYIVQEGGGTILETTSTGTDDWIPSPPIDIDHQVTGYGCEDTGQNYQPR